MGKEHEDDHEIDKMPDKETLEEFINGMHRHSEVYFDIEKKEFVWENPERNK